MRKMSIPQDFPPATQPETTAAGANPTGAAPNDAAALRQSWDALKKQNPRLYNREAARRLGVSEAQLVALDAGVLSFRLDVVATAGETETANATAGAAAPRPAPLLAFLRELAAFAPLLVIVRNDNAVLEITAGALRLEEGGGFINGFFSAAGNGFDVPHFHLLGESAAHVFAVHAAGPLRRSIQFFDAAGAAVIKFYLRDNTRLDAFDAWTLPYRSADQSPSLRRA